MTKFWRRQDGAGHKHVDGLPSGVRPSRGQDEGGDPLANLVRVLRQSSPERLSRASRADLLATIQKNIIPRMMIAHDRPTLEEANANAPVPPTEREIGELAQIAVSSDLAEALAFIANIRSDGTSLDVILLRLIAPAARRLGDDWLSDLRTFTEVTVGLGTLHEVVHALGPSLAEGIGKGIASRGSVVLVAAPSEQHTLGVYMLGEFFRRAGWAVQVDPTMSQDELVALVQAERVELVGITVSNTLLLQPLARFVAAVRLASKNPQTAFMVGGCLEAARDAKEIGAQFFSDPRDAVLWLERHVRHARAARQS